MGRFRRWLWQAGWLLRSLLERLSPTRRALLVVALALVFLGQPEAAGAGSWELPAALFLLLVVLMLELKDKLLARDELELGRSIQLSLLPDHDPQLAGWEIWLYSRPANDVGGDLVDYLELDSDRLAVFLGDVAGKGLGAALLMAKLQATLRALVAPALEPPDVVSQLNRIFCRDAVEGRFATLVHLELTAMSGRVRFVNAGHLPPLWSRPQGVEQSEPMSLPVGIEASEHYVEQTITLEAGDLLVVFSDGATEATNEKGEFYGDARLCALVEAAHGRGARVLGEEILRSVRDFQGESRPADDLSLVVLRRLG
jgi:sigma-B regulation protein RsbU (phosphoserine phosphatase)